ncbi:hypothetical protein ABK040_000684 [Willaertia magna]
MKTFNSHKNNKNFPAIVDLTGHGTGCCGIIVGDKKLGIAPEAQLIVAKSIYNTDYVNALRWAWTLGADIYSLSIGYLDHYSKELHDTIQEIILGGGVVVCSAANQGMRKNAIAFPAKYGNTICVGSHDDSGTRSNFSSVGREIDLLAPGEKILSTYSSFSPKFRKFAVGLDGTSFASPFVAGVCAIIMSKYKETKGKKLDQQQMKLALEKLCDSSGYHTQERGYDYIWIDSDVGMDDIFAIQLLLYFENTKYEISHISSIYGMTHNVMEGAFYLQSLLNYNNNNLLKVYNGINKPLQNQKEFHTFMEANWYTNIENNQNLFFKKEMNWNKIDNHPVDNTVDNTIPLMERKFKMENKLISFKNIPNNSITILALGPLTNIANYINIYGIEFTKKIKKIISMGGNAIFKKEITNQEIINGMDNNGKINFSNNTKIEWNYFCDPKSIKIVTKTFLNNFYLIGFDVIYENLITKDKLNNLLNILLQNNNLNNLQKINYKLLSINNDAYLYDPITSSYFIDKNLFLFEKVKIKINLESKSLENFASKIEICKSNEKDDYCEEEIEINVAKHLKVNEYYRLLERYFRMIGNNIVK